MRTTQIIPRVKLPIIIPIMDILTEVADRHNLPAWKLRFKSRKQKLVRARVEFMLVAEHAGYTHEEIADVLNRERSTITSMINKYGMNYEN